MLNRLTLVGQHKDAIMERAKISLAVIERAIKANPTSGQAGKLVRFLAAIHTGYDTKFRLSQ